MSGRREDDEYRPMRRPAPGGRSGWLRSEVFGRDTDGRAASPSGRSGRSERVSAAEYSARVSAARVAG